MATGFLLAYIDSDAVHLRLLGTTESSLVFCFCLHGELILDTIRYLSNKSVPGGRLTMVI